MKKVLSFFLPLFVAFSCVFGAMYFVVQQDMRISANDPQIQIAEDTASLLNRHHYLTIPQHSIDISQSLSPFLMTFDKDMHVVSSEAVLHDQTPTVPSGVFTYASDNGENRLTWQPEGGVRIAAVVTKYDNGFILVGRNLREVEKREDRLLQQIVLGWAATVVLTLLAVCIFARGKK